MNTSVPEAPQAPCHVVLSQLNGASVHCVPSYLEEVTPAENRLLEDVPQMPWERLDGWCARHVYLGA